MKIGNEEKQQIELAQQIQKSNSAIDQKISINPIGLHTQNVQRSSISYRKDIDGLRAIAVSAVVIFHAWPRILPGGFIGVDIFFVISGYLITKIIAKQALNMKFSYLKFYNRRIKRIYPALIVMLICVLYLGVQNYAFRQLEVMTETMAASTIFGANIQILLYKKGYFDPQTKSNPLLHLWSLGVEQQFYIFWPFIIICFMAKFKKKFNALMLSFTILSFIFNLIAAKLIGPQFDFYFPFCRFWQMSIGGMLAFNFVQIRRRYLLNILGVVGLLTICLFVKLFDENHVYPSFWAVFPTLASAFIILAGSSSFVNKHILGQKMLVSLGKISYSLYIWHWPLLLLLKIRYPPSSIFTKTQIIVAISILMSILSYFFIENPLRYRKQKKVTLILLITMAIMGIIAVTIHSRASSINLQQKQKYQAEMIPKTQDYVLKNNKLTPNSSKNRKREQPTIDKLKLSKFNLGRYYFSAMALPKKIDSSSKYYLPSSQKLSGFLGAFEIANQGQQNLILLVGDSHVGSIGHRFRKLYSDAARQNKVSEFPTIVSIQAGGSTIIPDDKMYPFVMQWIKTFKPNRILFVNYWEGSIWFNEGARMGYLDGLRNYSVQNYYANVGSFLGMAKGLIQQGNNLYITTFTPSGQEFDPQKMIYGNQINKQNIKSVTLSSYRSKYKKEIQYLEDGIKNIGGVVVDLSEHLCWDDICEVLTPSGYAIYKDNNHYSVSYSYNWAGALDFLVQF